LRGLTPLSINVRKCKAHKSEDALAELNRTIGIPSFSEACIVKVNPISETKQLTGGIRSSLEESLSLARSSQKG